MIGTPAQVITSTLRGMGPLLVPAISWGATASPFYKMAPEPAPAFPYVVFHIPPSSIQHTMKRANQGGGYVESFKVEFEVVGESEQIENVAAPWVPRSVYWLMDSYGDYPEQLNGDTFKCAQFTRSDGNGYDLDTLDEQRESGYIRIWIAKASYDMKINVPYPVRTI